MIPPIRANGPNNNVCTPPARSAFSESPEAAIELARHLGSGNEHRILVSAHGRAWIALSETAAPDP